mmetsp:Transcript_3888/g.6507  ORF Transcript_3888/g.6507 Transcript_3888/m.6507 type:complete len:306 (+) Transcript_3888:81-998(+)|eukprot:CAMPEP_0119013222 /NCGR_PEP_ID=MMETSP1176-20130426/8195_1 /TAXON_ID=265551 /ORGANISM="Synedropsis recta cf, Strain CCMP1620" /LENGTH=305 /DNA_ID=CAMNT_0006966291 /DNA_START=48 /DNA_END=965 /DNA_ORIENTATION=-
MTEGLLSIALAAAHVEAQQKRDNKKPVVPKQSEGSVPPSLPLRHSITVAPRQVSNISVADSSDEDPITDPEETLAKILEEQPTETPPPPSPEAVITSVLPDDVLCGRGGETNHHPGNVQYRGLVKKYQRLYLKAKRRDKPKIARLIVDTVRRRTGRFLKKDSVAGVWKDVGNNKAREKTSQALREGAPEIRENGTGAKRKVSIVGSNNNKNNIVTPNSSMGSLTPMVVGDVVKNYAAPYDTVPAQKKLKKSPVEPSTTTTTTDVPTSEAAPAMDASDSSKGPRLRILKSRLSNGSLDEESQQQSV